MLSVVESGFGLLRDPLEAMQSNRQGWTDELDELVAYLGAHGVTDTLVPVFAALADDTRWAVLQELGRSEQSASALATRFPVTRQAIAKHLAVLADAGLVEPVRVGREVRYRALGARLSQTAAALEAIGAEWDRRLAGIKRDRGVARRPQRPTA